MEENSTVRRVVIKFHAGYRGEEEPRKVIADDCEWPVEKILEWKRVLNHKTGLFNEEFTCLVNKRRAKLSIHSSGEQYLTFMKV